MITMLKKLPVLSISLAILLTGCGTTIETTMTKKWEKERIFDSEEDKSFSQMYMTDDGSAVTVISPGGVQAVNVEGETIAEEKRADFYTTFLNENTGLDRLTDKVTYIYIPHRHALLEFNYASFSESVSYIDLENKNVKWMADDLKWSLERYQAFARSLSKGLNFGGQLATGAAAEVMLPERFVGNLTRIIPELDAFIFKTLDGLKLISLKDGSVIWTNNKFDGGLVEIIYDKPSNSLVAVNRDDDAFAVKGLQFNKQLMRIDASTGQTIWENSYDGNIREKLDGVGVWADRRTDIRLKDGNIMINFLNVEVYDFETGEKHWQTTTGNDKLLDMVAPEMQVMNLFAFPEIEDGKLYRVTHENTSLGGVDVVIEAYDYDSGNLLWKTDKITRNDPVNDMVVEGDHLIASTTASEGIIAFDLSTGEEVWQYTGFGKHGIQFKMEKANGTVIAAGFGNIVSLNTDNGEPIYKLSTSDIGLGDLNDMDKKGNALLVSGSKGFGSFDLSDGSEKASIPTPSGGIMNIHESQGLVLIQPKPNYGDAKYPVDDAYHLVDLQNEMLLGTLGNGNRRGVQVSPDFSHLYVLTNGKIMMYSAN